MTSHTAVVSHDSIQVVTDMVDSNRAIKKTKGAQGLRIPEVNSGLIKPQVLSPTVVLAQHPVGRRSAEFNSWGQMT